MFTVLLEPRDKVMLIRYSGVLSAEDLSTLDAFVAGYVAREGYVRSIFDFTDVETFAIPRSRLVERGRKPRICSGRRSSLGRVPQSIRPWSSRLRSPTSWSNTSSRRRPLGST